MRIKKIAERRTICGDFRHKRNTDHWGCCRPDLHAKNARERASAACPDGAAAPKRPRYRSRRAGNSGSLQASSRLAEQRRQFSTKSLTPTRFLVCEEPSLTSFVASDRPSFRIRRVRPRRCNSSENLKSSSPAISKRLQIFRFASTPPGRYPHCLPEHRPLRHSRMSLIPCQSTPALDAAIHRPDSTLYQLQPSFHT